MIPNARSVDFLEVYDEHLAQMLRNTLLVSAGGDATTNFYDKLKI